MQGSGAPPDTYGAPELALERHVHRRTAEWLAHWQARDGDTPEEVARHAERVRQAVAEIHNLRKDQEKLTAELGLIQEENRRARRLLREHEELVAERSRLRERLERILGKLDKLKV